MRHARAATAALTATILLAVALVLPGSSRARAEPGCGDLSDAARTFEFSSGGASHPQGYGAWLLKVTASGAVSIAHDVRGQVTDYGTFALGEDEAGALWASIDRAGIERLESSTRPGVPGEVQYTFALADACHSHAVDIWVRDALEDESLTALVDDLSTLIETHTGQRPVLR